LIVSEVQTASSASLYACIFFGDIGENLQIYFSAGSGESQEVNAICYC